MSGPCDPCMCGPCDTCTWGPCDHACGPHVTCPCGAHVITKSPKRDWGAVQVRGQMAELAEAQQQQKQAALQQGRFQAALDTPLPPLPADVKQMGHEVVSAQATAAYAHALQVGALAPCLLQHPFGRMCVCMHACALAPACACVRACVCVCVCVCARVRARGGVGMGLSIMLRAIAFCSASLRDAAVNCLNDQEPCFIVSPLPLFLPQSPGR
jgi:hypothetical protein